jgi:ParB-like chromosome segregation protein Spo0J
MDIAYRVADTLHPHPLNERVYDAERDDSDLRRSIAAHGILTPITIDQHNTILAGHRRWRAACALTLESVPVIMREIDNPLEAELVLIESNRQREKTASERMHEADNLTRIFADEARRRMLAGKDDPRATLREGRSRTDAAVAEAVGMKERTYRKTKSVYDTAHDENAPAPIRAVAQEQMVALDTGQTTANAAEQALRKAKVAETMRTLPPGESPPDPFADKPRVRAARLVKNAYQALSATTNKLTYYTPEEMADAVELNGQPDYVTRDLLAVARWIADYERALRRRRSSLHVVS